MEKSNIVPYALGAVIGIAIVLAILASMGFIELPETPEETVRKTKAEDAIADAKDAIKSAERQGKDVSSAEEKLNEAQEAYESGNFEEAELLAEEAETLADIADEPEPEPEPEDDYPPALPDEFFG